MISKMLPLEQLGFYSLAYTAATAISLIISSLSAALMPSFASAHSADARQALLARYRSANEVMLYTTGLVLFALAFFGHPLLVLWVSAPAASQAWFPLAVLACGFWLSAAVSNPYTLCIASRKAHGPLIITLATGVFYVPLMYWAIRRWGIDGAAFAWVILNVSYVLTYIVYVHRVLLRIPVLPWFSRLLLPFAALGVATFGAARALLFVAAPAAGAWAALTTLALAAAAYTAAGYLLLDPSVRRMLRQMLDEAIRLIGSGQAKRAS
jgi:O-antigen/teichoic acid export membrane protein